MAMVSLLAKAEDGQDEHHDHDQTDEIDDGVHVGPPMKSPNVPPAPGFPRLLHGVA
jgi:hypothetical protein